MNKPLIVNSAAAAAPVFDACRVGAVLRAVRLVLACVLVVGLLFWPRMSWQGWLLHMGMVVGCALPAVLLWLMVLCAARWWLARLRRRTQWGLGVVLGAACGAFAASLLASVMEQAQVPWLGCTLAGALLAAQLGYLMLLRSLLHAPGNVAAQLAELQARIRPHFLFNALNSAIALVRSDPQRAEAVLENLSDVFRHMLKDVRHGSTLGQELDLARRYLEVEQVRFGSRLRLQWAIDPAANLAAMPALILQPLLENAVKHGVEPSAQGACIEVRTELRGNTVRIEVSNTVPAGTGNAGMGLALENVRRRLQLLYDMEAYFSAHEHAGRFEVQIQTPMRVHPAALEVP